MLWIQQTGPYATECLEYLHYADDLNFGPQDTLITNFFSNLHDEVLGEHISPQDVERFLLWIRRFRNRLGLISIVHSWPAMAFVLTLIAGYFNERAISIILFQGSIFLLMVSMLTFTSENQIAVLALGVHCQTLDQNEEWQPY